MSNRDWLREVLEYTDKAVIPIDAGIHKDGIPPSTVKDLGNLVRRVGDRVVITQAGRKFLNNKGETK